MSKTLITALALTFLLNLSVATADTTSTAGPKSRGKAVVYSLLSTLVPVVVGGALLLRGQGSAPIGSDPVTIRNNGQPEYTATLAGLAIGSAGIILGPGVGYAYAGKMGRFWRGVAIRGATASFTAVLVLSASENSDFGAGIVMAVIALVAGSSICLVSMTYDISTVGTSVDDYNRKHGFRNLTLRPTYYATHKAPGMMLTMSFQ